MAKRRAIGIVFAEDESWAGGFYYNLNIIKSFVSLPDEDKPILKIFLADFKNQKVIQEINYPYLKFFPLYPGVSRIKELANRILGKKKFKPMPYEKGFVDFVYPINYYCTFEALKNIKQIYWIPDMQHVRLPQNFSSDAIAHRELRINDVISKGFDIVFSSNDAKKDFTDSYPNAKNVLHVLQFPSILPLPSKDQINAAISKYSLHKGYFLSSNQFWKHKNHLLILHALAALKRKGKEVHVVFTGNMVDHCEKEYVEGLNKFVKEHDLGGSVSFLGYIRREEQLALLKGSVAVIQPSLFEGWSTIVEDCKALNHFIMVSDIRVHLEQIKENCLFFGAENAEDLAEKIELLHDNPPTMKEKDYKGNITAFAQGVLNITH